MFKKLKEKSNLEFLFVCIKIGIGVLLYRGSMDFLGSIIQIPFSIWMMTVQDMAEMNAINYLFQMTYSILAFACGAAILAIMLNIGKRSNYQPIYKKFKAPLLVPFMIISTVAINFVASDVSQSMIKLLAPDLFNSSITQMVTYDHKMSILEIVLLFVSTAIVPGVIEEIFFRGLVLTNLTPYGRGTAILGSALLFGLMHMNPSQFFYTTMMGIIIGYVYVRTKSIWVCIAIHILNNGLAVLQEVFHGTMGATSANIASSILTLSVVLLGGISIVVLLVAREANRKRAPAEKGSFGRICEPSLGYEERAVSRRGKLAMFFTPANGIFTVVIFGSMYATVGLIILVGLIYGLLPEGTMII